jgi:benzoyl-CoA reductase/2-hydroxyglutaryl-CoA dehydratase subunit BcrC/BadD/HgdB
MKANEHERNRSRSELKRANLISYYFKKAYETGSKVVYVNSFMPCEIFWALGFVPFNLGAIGGILSQGKASAKFINAAQQAHYSSDLCSTSRCILGAALINALPTPDFITITSAPCDVGSNIYYTLSQIYKKNWFLLDIPGQYNDQSITYLENQIKNMTAIIEQTFNIKLDLEKLTAAIDNSDETLAYLGKINELAKQVPSPLSAAESMEIGSSLHLLGSKDMAEIMKERYEEIRQPVQEKNPHRHRKPRVLWHGLRPFYSSEIFLHLENKCGVEIISEINVNGSSPYDFQAINPGEPFKSLAKMLMGFIGSFSLDSQTIDQQILYLKKEYTIDGIISFYSRGCRHMLSFHQVIRDIARKNGLPCLDIDGDYIDDRDYSFEQIKTRIDAFAELLHEKIGE